MSASNFYRTFYQTEQLFRLPNEHWVGEPASAAPEATELSVEPATNLLAQLDELSAQLTPPVVDTLLVDTPELITIPSHIDPGPTVVAVMPEPLPKSAPRPTVPPLVPPVQQSRLPQLNHKVLLLADEELDPSNLLFLEKILKAVNLNIDGVDLLNLHGVRDVDFADLVHGKKIHHFITFGVPFKRVHLDIAMDRYQPVRFFGINFLMADSLPTIEADQNLKRRLWTALQQVFLPQ